VERVFWGVLQLVAGWAIFGLNWLDYIMYILITMLLIRLYRVNNVFLVSVNVIIKQISIQIKFPFASKTGNKWNDQHRATIVWKHEAYRNK
jgi:hypothetical protein